MIKSSKSLQNVQKVKLPPLTSPPLYVIRKAPTWITDARSTAEAAALAIECLHPDYRGRYAANILNSAISAAAQTTLNLTPHDKIRHNADKPGYQPNLYQAYKK